MRTTSQNQSRTRRAFTLIELLSVMAIIGMLTAVVAPSFTSIKGGGDIEKAAYDIAGVLEQARAHAMANNTYVFVGMAEVNASNVESTANQQAGTGRVLLAVTGSKDGTRNFSTTNLASLSKIYRFEGLHLEDLPSSSGNMARPSVAKEYRVGNAAFVAESSFSWPLAAASPTYTFSKIIQFDPRGTASLQSTGRSSTQWLEIGLTPTKGDVAVASPNVAALLLDGVTGSVQIYRP